MKIKEKALLFLILGIIAFIANSAIWINYTSYDEDGWAKAMPNVLANPILLVSSFITFLLLSEAFFWFLVKNDCDDVGSSKFTAILFAFMCDKREKRSLAEMREWNKTKKNPQSSNSIKIKYWHLWVLLVIGVPVALTIIDGWDVCGVVIFSFVLLAFLLLLDAAIFDGRLGLRGL